MMPDEPREIVLYGSTWCPATRIVRRRMEMWRVPFRYVEVDDDPEAERLLAGWNNGRAIRPTLDLRGAILVNPDPLDLRRLLIERDVMTAKDG